jgi:hypothetical protein
MAFSYGVSLNFQHQNPPAFQIQGSSVSFECTSEFLSGRRQRVRVGGKLSEEVRVMSGISQGSVLGPLLFLAYVNDIWRNTDSTIILFADDCIINRKIMNNKDMDGRVGG